MRIADREKLSADGGKEVRGLGGHNHRAALPHAQHLPRPFEAVDRGVDPVGVQTLERLRHGGEVRGVELAAHVLEAVVLPDLAGEQIPLLPTDGGGIGDGQLESVVALVAQPAAEAGDGRLRHAAGVGELGNGHILGLVMMLHDVVGRLFLRGRQVIVGPADGLEYIFGHRSLTPPGSRPS